MLQCSKGVVLIVLAMMCFGAGTAAAFDLSAIWNQTYGGVESNESAYSIIQTENASLVIAGDTDAQGAGLTDAWLGVLDEEDGALLSDAPHGSSLNDTAFDVIQTEDGSIVFAGSTALPLGADRSHSDAWVVRIDASGEEELNQTFGGPEVNATAYSIIQTSDGGYLFVGSIEGYESGTTDAWMVKLNASGGEEWGGIFGGEENESAYSVIEDAEGGFLCAGATESYGDGEADAWVLKTNSKGAELWNATYGGAGDDRAQKVFQETTQNFSFIGTTTFFSADNRTDTDAWYLRFNETGAMVRETTLGGAEVNATAYSAADTPDGGLLLAGSIEDYGSGNTDAWLIKLDPSGEEQWNGALGGSNQDLARSIIRISETSYVFTGVFNATPDQQPPYHDAWAVRLDEVIEPGPGPIPVPIQISRGKIGDFVWEDVNRNGIQDEGEPGIGGVEIILYDNEGNRLRSRSTDAEGHYSFHNLEAGTYSLRFIRQEGYVFTFDRQGDDPALDSDADITTGRAGPINLAGNETDYTWDAGLIQVSPGVIGEDDDRDDIDDDDDDDDDERDDMNDDDDDNDDERDDMNDDERDDDDDERDDMNDDDDDERDDMNDDDDDERDDMNDDERDDNDDERDDMNDDDDDNDDERDDMNGDERDDIDDDKRRR
ncbi:MAG: SdrD B-like domain-containing protein [Methanomicrobiaceae archaeon]|nr:SdrD B-like domain-containing protein [Methanomicrobiaceae archaeon]